MDESKLPLTLDGRPNYSYLGHTSELIQTPYSLEGQDLEPGQPRRFPVRAVRTYAEEQERIRLAAIENVGRCQSRANRRDGWCRKWPMKGLNVCMKHGGKFVHSKKAGAKRYAEEQLQEKAKRIIASVK